MAGFIKLVLLTVSAFFVVPSDANSDEFNEELFFKTLPSGHIYGHFQFVTTWNTSLNSPASKHYRLFPRALGEIFETYSVKELHLSFSQGRWRHETWGYPVIDASSGAELLAWFQADRDNIDSAWLGLINVLSGMFCASLNFMDAKSTVIPVMNFRQTGVTSDSYKRHFDKHVRYAVLADENVCTENLTPWKKLLPCGLKAGLSSLLNANKLYDASYHSLGIHFRHTCINEDCTQIGLELSQTLGVVFDPIINLRISMNKPDWSFKRLFGRMISNACPLASISKVYVDISDGSRNPFLNLQPSEIAETTRNGIDLKYAVYNIPDYVSSNKAFNLEVSYIQNAAEYQGHAPFITTNRFQTGYGQVFGGVMCLIYNRHPTKSVKATYLEVIPHYLRMYFHTLKIESFKGEIGNVGDEGQEVKPLKLHYIPGLDSGRPYHLEIAFELPSDSVTRISFQFERQLLKWTNYPPDANHGFPVASSVLSVLLPSAENVTSPCNGQTLIRSMFDNKTQANDHQGYFVKIHTEPLLIMLPTPDFSMPYNVICLVCTVIAISFGSIHNLSTKSFVRFDPEKHKSFYMKIKDKIWKKKEKTQ